MGKTCPNSTLSATNPIWTDLAVNLGFCSKRSVTNCLSHGMALVVVGEVLVVGYSQHIILLVASEVVYLDLTKSGLLSNC
jgi:hypothetical protein